ncbi:bifunctional folylpolyglutamate synthase/dihydrofolate synthase [Bergeyella sp. RCAD1439]|uniref:bifunctional folylpolyglutamate synthase/dihydrofolate synthase n=1 Tax=Bergeyella anatis TaxID=3113737 RepID=UPI002E181DFF|nr:folylpolyglutamate synthase/dihydrofolate synthase family protein [Bergeyella sp. RCAD1439]
MTEKDYQEALDWLFVQAPNYQIQGQKAYKPGLDNIRALCKHFGNPQEQIQTIHIAGTNGKGSTSNMLASVLQEAGYKVGVYNSPHLVDFTERVKVNGKKADKVFVYDFIRKLKTLPETIRPSFFEYTTIMAFDYFFRQQVDFAIIEVGLGGRLDSTNIILPRVSAITNVSLDHTSILGDTVEAIAREKAGIIKPGVPVVCGDQNERVKEIIKEVAQSKETKYVDASIGAPSYSSDLEGRYQINNIKVVLGLVEELKNQGVGISNQNIEEGLKNVGRNTGFIGRWYRFSEDPLVICDTGHNRAGLEEVFSQLESMDLFKHMILGFVNDKDVGSILPLLPKNAAYYFVKPSVERGRHPSEYEEELKKMKINYKIFEDEQSAYLYVKQIVTKKEMIFVGGSNFVVGKFLEKNLQE